MDWLRDEIAKGFQRLICLCLDRQPTDDLIEGTMAAWFDAWCLGNAWDQQLDSPRFHKAFVRFSAHNSGVWPQPGEILALLPDREKFVALSDKPANTEKTQQMIDGLKELFRIPD